jgi:hypothetical protein
MSEPQTIFGQTTALANAVVAFLQAKDTAGAFVLSIAPQRRIVERTDIKEVPLINAPVLVDIYPGNDAEERQGLSGTFMAHYVLNMVMQQKAGSSAETQGLLLLQLRTQIIEAMKQPYAPTSGQFQIPSAVQPFQATLVNVATPKEGAYDMQRLVGDAGLFYSDTILTFRAAI